ncbi:LacI family transcriptional regulator [Pseudarthrobacter sp. NamE2]|uniref:LacI family DNA-binding transcriptional regulator n=1 Tax=Pseudarthrobacter sp. NamE2 TaxID=2576838 RepID=UPI0010FE18DF|nr:LacI family DNA-binding transcriptional regulator [Pseudarthrobacter sp. NamE2]TLM81288.1 LacI family transcriptional regulator [Pseudarthrobacter sp. NamE2]
MTPPPRVTITQVAAEAGVSTATAGRVLGGYGYASSEVATRVEAAARKLGYKPNTLARGLVTGRSQTIGVVAADIDNAFYARVLRGIGDVARPRGFGVILTNSDENLEREREAVQLLLEKRVDGLIISPCDVQGPEHLRSLIAGGIPTVQVDRAAYDLAADSVTVDNRGAAREAIAHLLETGHKRIGIIAELEQTESASLEDFVAQAPYSPVAAETLYPSWQRLLGYLDAHRDAGVPVQTRLIRRAGAYSSEAARSEAIRLLEYGHRPTAVFAADGTMAHGLMQAIASLKLKVPDQLSVVCFDDLEWMTFMQPAITAIHQPVHRIGSLAAELLLARIAGEASVPKHNVLEARLNKRDSVGPPPRM